MSSLKFSNQIYTDDKFKVYKLDDCDVQCNFEKTIYEIYSINKTYHLFISKNKEVEINSHELNLNLINSIIKDYTVNGPSFISRVNDWKNLRSKDKEKIFDIFLRIDMKALFLNETIHLFLGTNYFNRFLNAKHYNYYDYRNIISSNWKRFNQKEKLFIVKNIDQFIYHQIGSKDILDFYSRYYKNNTDYFSSSLSRKKQECLAAKQIKINVNSIKDKTKLSTKFLIRNKKFMFKTNQNIKMFNEKIIRSLSNKDLEEVISFL